MNIEEAKQKGYELIKASPFEVGLVKNGKGLRTWFAVDFEGKMPGLDHPLVQHAIQAQEDHERMFKGYEYN